MYNFSEVVSSSSLSIRNWKFRDTGLIEQKEYQTKKQDFYHKKELNILFCEIEFLNFSIFIKNNFQLWQTTALHSSDYI